MTHQKAIDPMLWGSSAWHILHRLSFGFRNAKEGRAFYESLLAILPCPKCRESFHEHLKRLPFPSNHKDIPQWCVKLHNIVNRSIGKDDYASTMDDIKAIYSRPSEMEWTFISALVDSHPGKRYITQDLTNALETFLTEWAKSWENPIKNPSKGVVQSKTLLREWVRKNNGKVIGFGVCASNTCELRAGRFSRG